MGLYDLILLRRGSKGVLVKKMQGALALDDDGKFGPGTEKSVRDYQEKNELEVDGLAGPAALWASVGESTEGTLDKLKSLFS